MGPATERSRYRRRRRIRAGIAAGMVVLALAAAGIAARGLGGADPNEPVSTNLPPATATVTRETLTQTERVNGTLGYGPATTLIARAGIADGGPSSAGAPPTTNTVTWLPALGTVVKPGEPAYKVDDRAVVLLSGTTPLYRLLSTGVRGADVAMLESNLATLGYRGFVVDTAYTSSTAAAARRWQKDLGLAQTGTVDVNQVVVAPGELRVSTHKTTVGADAVGPVLDYTATARVVTVPLAVSRQHLVHDGLSATVTLPDGKTVTGTVASVGTVATTGGEGQDRHRAARPPSRSP